MDVPKVDPKQFVESFREEMESHLQAVNGAPDGEWIAGSEEQVRDLSAR